MGTALLQLKRAHEAAVCLQHAAQLHPRHRQLHSALAAAESDITGSGHAGSAERVEQLAQRTASIQAHPPLYL